MVALLFFFGLISSIYASHFRGGTITWRPISDNGATVTVEFQAVWSWRRSFTSTTYCDDNTISSGILMGINENIVCRIGCKTSGEVIGTTNMKCNDYETSEDWSRGDKVFQFTIPKTNNYQASYQGNAWITLNTGSGAWEVRTMLDVTNRADTGWINTSPVTQVPQFIKMRKGFSYEFQIPTYDVDGDFVRCRFSESLKGECGGVCFTGAVPASINSYSCGLTFDANKASVGYYALSVTLEDFMKNSSTSPMSSVPIQLLIQVVTVSSSCVTSPTVIGDRPSDSCIGVPIGTKVSERIVAQVSCTTVTMYDIQMIGSSGMAFAKMAVLTGTTNQYYTSLTWTPTAAQRGPNVVCARAIDSTYLSSDLYCFTLLAGITAPAVVLNSQSPSGALSTALLTSSSGIITWSVKFDQSILRPTKPRYVYIYTSTGTELFRLDVSVFPTVYYNNDILSFETTDAFAPGSYYITLGYGIGTGTLYCKPESDAELSSTFWTFTVSLATTTIATTTTALAAAPTAGTATITGLSSTASPILPVGMTVTTATTTTSANSASTAAGTGTTISGVTITASIVSGVTTTSSTVSGATTNFGTNTIGTTNTAITTVTITTTRFTPYTTTSNKANESNPCSRESFMIVNAIVIGGGLVIHVVSVFTILYCLTK